ncbi:MAG: SIS domain-containing protein [Alphaproteobacteria bacterium]|nr:SIS domain-containing protein [Alphaproteobacteria bacterium]
MSAKTTLPIRSADSGCAAAEQVRALLRRSIAVKESLIAGHAERVVEIAELCAAALAAGGKLMFCGNGGSAADAQHLAAELLIRLRSEVNRQGLPALALATDSSSLTACGNDYDFETYYARMAETLGRPGDVLIAITTSGRSPNIVRALQAVRTKGIKTIGLLGNDGGPALAECDLALIVPSKETGRIQEAHIAIGHAVMELIEDRLLAAGLIKS